MGLVGTGVGLLTQAQNQQNQEKQNVFNATEAVKNRNFQAQQAQLARDYQTEFYETYQSPSAMVRQYQDAGINPALAAGYSPSTPPAVSSPSGSAASAASPNYQSVSSMIDAIGNMAMLKAQIENVQADTSLKGAQAFNAERQGLLANSTTSLNSAQIRKLSAEIDNIIAQTSSEKEKKALLVLEQQLKNQDMRLNRHQININSWKQSVKERYGFYPSDYTVDAVIGAVTGTINSFTSVIGNNLGDMINGFIKSKSTKKK